MIFCILAFITLFISICIKDRKKSLIVQRLNCFFKGLYDLWINAYTAAAIDLVNVIRSSFFIKKEKFSKKVYFALLIIFETIIVISCIFTWEGLFCLLPTLASMIRTFCLWHSNMKYVRFSGILSGLLFALYYIHYNGWLMAIGYIILIFVSLYNVLKVDFIPYFLNKKKANKE